MGKVNMNIENKLPVSIIRIVLVVVIALVMVLVFVFNSGIMAKYMHQTEEESLYVAQNFYFESDYLKPMQDNGQYVSYTLQTGVKDIVFELRNYEDELRSSEVDIEYTIFLNEVEQTQMAGTLGMNDEDGRVTISLEDLSTGSYLVTATATEPYSATIGAQFVVNSGNNDISYTTYGSAESSVMLLKVETYDYAGNITLTWDNEHVYPDVTDPMLKDAVAANGTYVVNMESHSEYDFRFFKSDLTKDYKSTLSATITNTK